MDDVNALIHRKKVEARAADAAPPVPKYKVAAAGLTDRRGNTYGVIQDPRPDGGFVSRRVYVGDTLPEGNVTGITAEGLRVIPDEGDEFMLGLGSGDAPQGVAPSRSATLHPAVAQRLSGTLDEDARTNSYDVRDPYPTNIEEREGRKLTYQETIDAMTPEDWARAKKRQFTRLRNPNIYSAANEAEYNDMVNTDFARYNENADGHVVRSDSKYDGTIGATVHSFEREDGVVVKFAEDDDGDLHNITR